jgi:ketosteroid isomerase-like protein
VINVVPTRERAIVEQYVAAMQAGPGGLEALLDLFTSDAVYVEPFSGRPTVHRGQAAIRAFFADALSHHLQGARLLLERLDLDGERLRSQWTCHVPLLPGPLRGHDLLTLRDGRIARLETTLDGEPAA